MACATIAAGHQHCYYYERFVVVMSLGCISEECRKIYQAAGHNTSTTIILSIRLVILTAVNIR